MKRKKILIKLILITMLFLSDCSKVATQSPAIGMNENPIKSTTTFQMQPSMTLTMNYASIPFHTPSTITTTFSKPNQTHTPTKIITPVPTLSEIQSKEYFINLLKDNSNCKLPCSLGITPGISTWEETRNMLIHMGMKFGDYAITNEGIYHGSGIEFTSPFIQTTLGYYENNDIIRAINISSVGYEDKQYFRNMWNYFSPDELMSNYGAPSEIYINTGIGHGEVGGAGSSLILKYDEFLIIYNIKPIEVNQNGIKMYHICPSWLDIVWDPNINIYIISNNVFSSIDEYINLISSNDLKSYKLIEEAAGITVNDFYNKFLQGNVTACFDTPQNIWP